MPERRHHIEIEEIDGVTVVSLKDPQIAEGRTIEALGEELFRLVDRDHPMHLVLDFRDVCYVSSEGLAKFLALKRKVAQTNGAIKLCNVNPVIMDVLRTSQMIQIFDVQPEDEPGGPGAD